MHDDWPDDLKLSLAAFNAEVDGAVTVATNALVSLGIDRKLADGIANKLAQDIHTSTVAFLDRHNASHGLSDGE
jgi:hypothetical protein